jgi:hypothetical protein
VNLDPSISSIDPAVMPSLTSALVAAAVAILVLAVSQYLIFKKGRTDFLTPKLEELYLLLNELAHHNVTQFTMHYEAAHGRAEARNRLKEMDVLDLYGHRRAKTIIMYVRLYFPRLSKAHQRLFAAERALNDLQHATLVATTVDVDDLTTASGEVGHLVGLMEQELIRNREVLLRATILPRPYRATTDAELANRAPRPAGSPFSGQG